MSNDSTFFDDVFDDPKDDPLLGDEDASAENGASEEPERQGPPSWMSEDTNMNGHPESEEEKSPPPERKQIVVDQQGNEGMDALNQAVGQGWQLVRIALARPDGERAATHREAHRFVAILEQDRPQSLFDFGSTG